MRLRYVCLTGAALLCRTLAWFPLWLLLLSLYPAAQPAHYTLMLLGTGLCTAAAVRAIRRRTEKKPLRRNLLTVLAAAIAGGLCCSGLFYLTGAWAIPAALTLLCVLTAIHRADADADALFPPAGYVACLTGAVIVPVLLGFAEQAVPMGLILTALGTETVLFLLLRNQLMLLRMVNRRSKTETDVPAHIRRGNLMLVGGVILLLTVLFLCRAPIAAGLELLWQGILWLLRMILLAITRFVAWLGGNAPAAQDEFPDAVEEEVQRQGSGNPLWRLLWIPFAAVTWYIWRTFLSDWAEAIREGFAALLVRLSMRLNPAGKIGGAGGAYTDIETEAERTETSRSKRRAWQKAYRAWRDLPESDGKFYAGYALLLSAPAWTKSAPRDSDTVREICAKWAQCGTEADALDAVTADFDADRYAQHGLPAQALDDMAQALERMRKGG